MTQSTCLKLAAILFTAFWIAYMLWYSDSISPLSFLLMVLSGLVVGYGWYRAMRWQLPRGRVPLRR
jgi:hypothetical protein